MTVEAEDLARHEDEPVYLGRRELDVLRADGDVGHDGVLAGEQIAEERRLEGLGRDLGLDAVEVDIDLVARLRLGEQRLGAFAVEYDAVLAGDDAEVLVEFRVDRIAVDHLPDIVEVDLLGIARLRQVVDGLRAACERLCDEAVDLVRVDEDAARALDYRDARILDDEGILHQLGIYAAGDSVDLGAHGGLVDVLRHVGIDLGPAQQAGQVVYRVGYEALAAPVLIDALGGAERRVDQTRLLGGDDQLVGHAREADGHSAARVGVAAGLFELCSRLLDGEPAEVDASRGDVRVYLPAGGGAAPGEDEARHAGEQYDQDRDEEYRPALAALFRRRRFFRSGLFRRGGLRSGGPAPLGRGLLPAGAGGASGAAGAASCRFRAYYFHAAPPKKTKYKVSRKGPC